MKAIFFLILRLLLKRKRQTLVAVLGVSIGVGAFVAMASLMNGFQKYFIEQAIDLNSHITLKVKDEEKPEERLKRFYGEDNIFVIRGAKPKEKKDKVSDHATLITRYEKDKDIVGVSPHLNAQGIIRYGVLEKTASLIGIDPMLERKSSVIDRFIVNNRLNNLISDRYSIIIGRLLAQDLGIVETGKKVIITTPNGNTQLFKVVDFFDSGITYIDQTRVYMNIKTLQTMTGKPNEVNEIVFKIKDVHSAEDISRRISKETGYYTESWQFSYRNFLQIFKIQNYVTYIIVFAILVVSAFGIFNIIMMTVMEKRRDIAILKALGYEDKDIVRVFAYNGLIIGIIGSILGSALGFLIQEYLASVDIEVQGIIRTKGFLLDRNPLYFFYGILFAIVFSFFASFYPSYKASKLNPIDIFRSGG
ncbi:MAG: ABC transporter permease [Thermodesulfovibrionales bacterium]|nr:ABC transporter permease [Thermodesulfovibrionales bacterium]